jgi:Na+/pantothenate symporter
VKQITAGRLLALPVFGLAVIGGYAPAMDELRQQDPTLLSLWGPDGQSLKSLFTIFGFLAIGLGFLGSPQIFVRFLSLRSVDEVRPGAIVAVIWTLLATFSAVLIGMIGRAILMEPAQMLPDVLGQGGQVFCPCWL